LQIVVKIEIENINQNEQKAAEVSVIELLIWSVAAFLDHEFAGMPTMCMQRSLIDSMTVLQRNI
jgi:hypothetical protein